MTDPPVFSLDEDGAEGWLLVERLTGRGPSTPRAWPRRPWFRAPPSRALQQAVARLLPAAILERWLAQASPARTVLRSVDGRTQAVASRPWDPDANAVEGRPLDLRFTPAVDELWRSAIVALGEALGGEHLRGERAFRDRVRRVARLFAPEPAVGLGDHLAFVLFHQNLRRLRLDDAIARRAAGRLRSGSALARLFAPEEPGSPLSSMVLDDPDLLRAVELCMPDLAAAWGASAALLWQAEDREQLVRRCQAMAASVAQWLAITDAHGRLDLAEPVAAWFAALAAAPGDWRARLVRLPGVATVADRDALAAIVADTIELGPLDERLGALASARYGDERFAEARVVRATLEEQLAPIRDAVRSRIGLLRGRLR